MSGGWHELWPDYSGACKFNVRLYTTRMSLHANILCQICAGIATLSLSSILIWFYQYMQTHVSKADSEHLRYLSEAELVVRLGLSLRAIIKLRNNGVLPHLRLGRRILYKWADVEAALESYRKGGI